MATVVVALASWPREPVIERTKPQAEITPEPKNSKPVHRPSDVKPQLQPEATVAADQPQPAAPHQPQNIEPLPLRPPVSQPQLVAMDPPPEPETRTPALVQDAAVIPVNAAQPLSKTTTHPTQRELIDRALRQRFVSFQASGKTPLRQLVRELNELANGFIVVSPNVTSEMLNKTVTLSLRETSLLDVLNAVARVTDLKIVVAEERIELGP